VAKHGSTLKEVRWSNDYACRALGGVVATQTQKVASKAANE
jgi:hypothetical protein